MPHLELSVSDPHLTQPRPNATDRPLDSWAAAVTCAQQPCLLLDNDAAIVALSAAFGDIVGAAPAHPVVGRDLLSGVLRLRDFAHGADLTDDEISKIPPILALTSGRLARGLLRLQGPEGPEGPEGLITLDAIATPLTVKDATAGSLTFFSTV